MNASVRTASVLLREDLDHIAVLTLNRPDARNSLSEALIAALTNTLRSIADDRTVRVVVLAANGPGFCAGHDMKEMTARRSDADRGRAYFNQLMAACSTMMQTIVHLPKPVIAAVQGAAIGGGTTMLTHCDFVFAGESARFQMPFVNLAVVPEFGSSYSVPARSGYLRAAELILLGLPFNATRAADLGLVTRVMADEKLLETATQTARDLAKKPPAALRACKRLMRSSTREQLERAAKFENEEFSVRVRSAEAKEAFTAFIEKRKPNFEGISESKARAA